MNARKNVPSVDGAGTHPPSNRRVRPARSTPQSSTLSAPSSIANTSAITLRPAFAAPALPPQADHTTGEILDPEPPRERRGEHDPSVRNRPLVIEINPQAVQSDSHVIMHHEGDLLTAAATAVIGRFPCSGGHSSSRDRTEPPYRRGGSGLRPDICLVAAALGEPEWL